MRGQNDKMLAFFQFLLMFDPKLDQFLIENRFTDDFDSIFLNFRDSVNLLAGLNRLKDFADEIACPEEGVETCSFFYIINITR